MALEEIFMCEITDPKNVVENASDKYSTPSKTSKMELFLAKSSILCVLNTPLHIH